MAPLKTTLSLILVLHVPSLISGFQCMSENNEPVDWFVAYKLPKLKHANSLIAQGLAYAFMTSDNFTQWTLSELSINSSNCMIGNTLHPLFTPNNTFIAYNDQPPNEESKSSKGHNKGVVLANKSGGLWLIHSVPHFPAPAPPYKFPPTGLHYGQSFLCMSLNLDNLNQVGLQLQYNEPQIFLQQIADDLRTEIPELSQAAANMTIKSAPWYRTTTLTSKRGLQFQSFAKSRNFNKDLYEDWLAPALQTNLIVETWPNGAGRLPSNCTKPFKVFNIDSVTIKAAQISFSTTHDHSKWAVSEVTNGSSWICIGDINRMEHQKSRGGGAVCLQNKVLANDYQKSVAGIEKCQMR